MGAARKAARKKLSNPHFSETQAKIRRKRACAMITKIERAKTTCEIAKLVQEACSSNNPAPIRTLSNQPVERRHNTLLSGNCYALRTAVQLGHTACVAAILTQITSDFTEVANRLEQSLKFNRKQLGFRDRNNRPVVTGYRNEATLYGVFIEILREGEAKPFTTNNELQIEDSLLNTIGHSRLAVYLYIHYLHRILNHCHALATETGNQETAECISNFLNSLPEQTDRHIHEIVRAQFDGNNDPAWTIPWTHLSLPN